MRKLSVRSLAVPLFLITVTTSFQNCDGGFRFNSATRELASVSGADDAGFNMPSVTTGPFALRIYGAGGALLSDTAPLDSGLDFQVQAGGAGIETAILTWSIPASGNTAGCTLAATGNMYRRNVRCLASGLVQVRVAAIWNDGSESTVFTNRTVQTGSGGSTPTNSNPDLADFRIRAGTGSGAWNTANTAPVVFVGQTLRIYNDDNVPHRLHTAGSPCPHQDTDIAPNGSSTCVIASAHPVSTNDLYDHNVGTSASFYLNAIDGAAKYAGPGSGSIGSCASCHGAIASSMKRGAGFSLIKAAIQTNKGGMGAITLSDDDLRAIAYRLSK